MVSLRWVDNILEKELPKAFKQQELRIRGKQFLVLIGDNLRKKGTLIKMCDFLFVYCGYKCQ